MTHPAMEFVQAIEAEIIRAASLPVMDAELIGEIATVMQSPVYELQDVLNHIAVGRACHAAADLRGSGDFAAGLLHAMGQDLLSGAAEATAKAVASLKAARTMSVFMEQLEGGSK